MPQWNLNVTPGGATGGLSAPQIGGGNMNWGPLMDMLRWRMQMQERGESARLDAIKQQMKMAKDQYRAQKIERGKAGMKRGLGRADTSKIDDYMKAWRMAQSMVGPGTPGAVTTANPLASQQLTGQIGAIGPQAAHEGQMQYGQLMAGMAGQAGGIAGMQGAEMIRQGIDPQTGQPFGGRYGIPRKSSGKSLGGKQKGTLGDYQAGTLVAGGYTAPEGTTAEQIAQHNAAMARLASLNAPQAPPPDVPPPVDPGAGFEAVLNPQSANLGMNVAPGMQPGSPPPMAPTAPSVQPRPGNVTGDPMAPGQIFGGDPQGGTGLQAQQKAQGAGFQFGGGVPETGTYRLHKGEIEIDPGGGFGRIPSTGKYKVPEGAEIVPAKLADVLMPSIAASRKSKGKAKKDYQGGTLLGGMDPEALAEALRLLGESKYGRPRPEDRPVPPGVINPLEGLFEIAPEDVPIESVLGAVPGQPYTGLAQPAAAAAAPSITEEEAAPQPDYGLSVTEEAPIPGGAAEAAGQADVSKYTLRGKPETPEEQQQRELDSKQREIDRHKEQADSLSTSALKYERWARENPNKPAAQQLWAMSKEHMANSKQMYSTADALQKSLDARRGIITEAEAELEVAEVQAGGYVGSAQVEAQGKAGAASRKTMEDAYNRYMDHLQQTDLDEYVRVLQESMLRQNPEVRWMFGATGAE